MRNQSGQTLILIAVLLVVVLIIMAVIIDSGRLLLERQEIKRASAAGGKAGLIYVGNLMITQMATSYQTATLTPGTVTPIPSCIPGTGCVRLEENLTDQDRVLLVSAPVRTQVASKVRQHLRLNGYLEGKEGLLSIEVIYPFEYRLENENLEIFVRLTKVAPALYSGFVPMENGVITGESRQSVFQR